LLDEGLVLVFLGLELLELKGVEVMGGVAHLLGGRKGVLLELLIEVIEELLELLELLVDLEDLFGIFFDPLLFHIVVTPYDLL
jgi:hypothetical protein